MQWYMTLYLPFVVAESKEERGVSVKAKLLRWLFFTILFPLVPIAYAYARAASLGPPVEFRELVARGGLLLLAVGLCAGGIGDLLLTGKRWLSIKVAAGGFCGLCAFGAGIYYPVPSEAYTESITRGIPLAETLNIGFSFWLSVVLYGVSIFTSLVCVGIVELEAKLREEKQS